MPQIIDQINVGVVDGRVAWIIHYDTGDSVSFGLDAPIARQFCGALQEAIRMVEAQHAPPTAQDGIALREQVAMRLRSWENN